MPYDVNFEYSRIAGMKTLDAINFIMNESKLILSGGDLQKIALLKQKILRELLPSRLKVLPGVDEFLQWARRRFSLAMASSGSTLTVKNALHILGYSNFFIPLICAEDVLHAKPNPECFLTILKILNFPAEKALIFEDSEAGFIAAKASGIDYLDAKSMLGFNLN